MRIAGELIRTLHPDIQWDIFFLARSYALLLFTQSQLNAVSVMTIILLKCIHYNCSLFILYQQGLTTFNYRKHCRLHTKMASYIHIMIDV